jgi:hypothetical protein
MALLTAPFPNQDPTSLAKLVLAGMQQLGRNLDAQDQIAQNEEANFLATSKQATNNALGIAETLARQREDQRKAQQDQFNNFLGLQQLGGTLALDRARAAYYLGLGKGGNNNSLSLGSPGSVSVVSGDDASPPPAAPTDPEAAPDFMGPPRSAMGNVPQPGAPPAGMAMPNLPGQPSAAIAPSTPPGASIAGLLPPAPQSAQPSFLMQQPTGTVPAGTPQTPRAGYDDALKLREDSAAEFKTANGFDYSDKDKVAKAGPQVQQDAAQIQRLTDQLDAAKRAKTTTPATTASGSRFDWSNIKDGDVVKKVTNDGNMATFRKKSGNVQIEWDEYVQNGQKHRTAERVIMPDKITQAPMAVQLPKDKAQAYDTAKFWLEKVYPGMDVKDKAANRDQAMQMHQMMVTLGNDPDVQGHLMKMGFKDAVPPPGMEVAGYKPDMKDNTQVPYFKKSKPEDVEAQKQKNTQMKELWDQYKNWQLAADATKNSDKASRDVAKAKASALLKVIQQMDNGVKPGNNGQQQAGPGSAAFYYGQ